MILLIDDNNAVYIELKILKKKSFFGKEFSENLKHLVVLKK